MSAIVFLDVDGVIVTLRSKIIADPEAVAALNWLTDSTGAVIVVSSTWRKAGFQRIAEILASWGITGQVVSVTPDLGWGIERGCEIRAWLCGHNGPFVILDDEADMGSLDRFLVRTNYDVGLTMEDAIRAAGLLLSEV